MPVAVVTGAGGNLGRVVVTHLLTHNWTVVATVSPGKQWPDQPHPRLHVQAIDLTNSAEVSNWLPQVFEQFKQVHAGLMLAGGFAPGHLHQADGSALRLMLERNALTAWNVAQPLAMHMLRNRSGRLIFIGARPALRVTEGTFALPYAFSKSLLLRYSEALNFLGKENQVSSYVLIPHIIDTPDNRKAMPHADFNSWVKPEKLANIILALAGASEPEKESVIMVE